MNRMDTVIKIDDGYIATRSDESGKDLRLVFHLDPIDQTECYYLYLTQKGDPIYMGWSLETNTFEPNGYPIIVSQDKIPDRESSRLFKHQRVRLESPDLSRSYGTWYIYLDQINQSNISYDYTKYYVLILLLFLIFVGVIIWYFISRY